MLNRLKKSSKSSNKSGTPENPTHQTTDIGAESGRDSEGEYRSRNPRADMADGTDSIIAPDINNGRGPQITNQDGGDVGDVDRIQSGKYRSKSWYSSYTTVRVEHY